MELSLATGTKSSGSTKEKILTDDQCFLMYFIISTYFGPDLKDQTHPKSISQRKAENLPHYMADQLAGSHIRVVELERVYHYVIGRADQSLRVKLPLLRQYLHGNCKFHINYPQFSNLFPSELHPFWRFKKRYWVIGNLVFIDNPETHHIDQEEIKRFKRLTGLQSFPLNQNLATLHNPLSYARDSPQTKDRDFVLGGASEEEIARESLRLDYQNNDLRGPPAGEADAEEKVGQGMIIFPSCPTKQEWLNVAAAAKSGFAVAGTAATGGIGPLLGRMDIGEFEDSYLFRVALPGVKRDEREFSCEVEDTGKVLIRGVTTTGTKRVYRYSLPFEMQSQNLCPPGHFSVSFQLPGPVNPQKFSGSYSTDGIFEGVVMKRQETQDTLAC